MNHETLSVAWSALWGDNAWALTTSFIEKMIEKWLDYNVKVLSQGENTSY